MSGFYLEQRGQEVLNDPEVIHNKIWPTGSIDSMLGPCNITLLIMLFDVWVLPTIYTMMLNEA